MYFAFCLLKCHKKEIYHGNILISPWYTLFFDDANSVNKPLDGHHLSPEIMFSFKREMIMYVHLLFRWRTKIAWSFLWPYLWRPHSKVLSDVFGHLSWSHRRITITTCFHPTITLCVSQTCVMTTHTNQIANTHIYYTQRKKDEHTCVLLQLFPCALSSEKTKASTWYSLL